MSHVVCSNEMWFFCPSDLEGLEQVGDVILKRTKIIMACRDRPRGPARKRQTLAELVLSVVESGGAVTRARRRARRKKGEDERCSKRVCHGQKRGLPTAKWVHAVILAENKRLAGKVSQRLHCPSLKLVRAVYRQLLQNGSLKRCDATPNAAASQPSRGDFFVGQH